jgi:hypothetical protein
MNVPVSLGIAESNGEKQKFEYNIPLEYIIR